MFHCCKSSLNDYTQFLETVSLAGITGNRISILQIMWAVSVLSPKSTVTTLFPIAAVTPSTHSWMKITHVTIK